MVEVERGQVEGAKVEQPSTSEVQPDNCPLQPPSDSPEFDLWFTEALLRMPPPPTNSRYRKTRKTSASKWSLTMQWTSEEFKGVVIAWKDGWWWALKDGAWTPLHVSEKQPTTGRISATALRHARELGLLK